MIQTGSGQISQRVDPGLVDPRLLGADLSRIGLGVEQGMGMANNFATMRENAKMRPIRGALANLELAKAEEYAAQAENRGLLAKYELAKAGEYAANAGNRSALDDSNVAFAQARNEAAAFNNDQDRQTAAINAQKTVVLDNLGRFERGGERNSVGLAGTEFQFNPVVTGDVQRVRLSNGEIVVREIPTGGSTRAQVKAAYDSQESKNANQQAQFELQQERVDIARQKLEADLANLQAKGEAGDGEIRQFNGPNGEVLIGVYSVKAGGFTTQPQIVPGAVATSYDPVTGLIREAADRRAGGSAGKPAARNTGVPAVGNTGAPRSAVDNFIYGSPTPATTPTPSATTSASATPTPTQTAIDSIIVGPRPVLDSVTQKATPRNDPRTRALSLRAVENEKETIAEAKATVAEIEQILAQGGVSRKRLSGGRGGSDQVSGFGKLTPGEAKEYEKRYAQAKAKLAALGL